MSQRSPQEPRDAVPGTAAGRGNRAARGADLQLMRQLNRLMVLNSVRQLGPLARVGLAKRTGLSGTTISSIVEELIGEGLLLEGPQLDAARSGGRRPISLHFNTRAGYVIGVDLGRTHFTALVTDLGAKVLARRSGPFQSSLGPDVCLPILVTGLRTLVAETGIPWKRIKGVGVSIPGPVDTRQGILIQPPGMPGWGGVEIRTILSGQLDVPVYLDNDANMGALGESRFGAGRGVSNMAYVKVATGTGCGLVVNGSIYRGSFGSAGELGHVTIDEEGPLCDCGNRGCLETFASAHAIVHDAVHGISLAREGSTARPTPRDEASTDIADVVTAALAGDPAAIAAIRRAGEHVGVAVAGLVNLMNPSLILIDGGVARAGDILLEPIRNAIATRSLKAASTNACVELAALGEDAIALGAVAAVIDAAFSLPQTPAMQPHHIHSSYRSTPAGS